MEDTKQYQSSDTLYTNEQNNSPSKNKIPNNNDGLFFPNKRSKVKAYLYCILFGLIFGAHQNYISGKRRKNMFGKMEYGIPLKAIPYLVGLMMAIVGYFLWRSDEKGPMFFIIGICINAIYWIFDLITLGKQVDKWNAKHASDI